MGATIPAAVETVDAPPVGDVNPVELTVVVAFAGDEAPKEKTIGFGASLGCGDDTAGIGSLCFSPSVCFLESVSFEEDFFPKPVSLMGLLISAEMPLLVTVAVGIVPAVAVLAGVSVGLSLAVSDCLGSAATFGSFAGASTVSLVVELNVNPNRGCDADDADAGGFAG